MASPADALLEACERGDVLGVRAALAAGANVHAGCEAALEVACGCGNTNVVAYLLSLEGDQRVRVNAMYDQPFTRACMFGHADTAAALLALRGDRRVDVHTWGGSAFRLACEGRFAQVMCLLASQRGDRAVPIRNIQRQKKLHPLRGLRWVRRRALYGAAHM